VPVISPELVLVDPELARRARAALPDPGASNGSVPPTRSNGRPATAVRPIVGAGAVAGGSPAAPAHLPLIRLQQAVDIEVKKEALSDPPGPRRLLLAAASVAVFLLGLVVPPFFAGGDPVLHPPPQPSAAGRDQAGIGRAVASGSPSALAPAVRPPARAAPPPTVPTRLFVWLSDQRAHYYNVRFSKGRQTVFEAWPTDARVTVPLRGTFRGRSFAFAPGRYRWVVRPGFGPRSQRRLGRPLVRSVWVVRQ
jgi:hypothetical protein